MLAQDLHVRPFRETDISTASRLLTQKIDASPRSLQEYTYEWPDSFKLGMVYITDKGLTGCLLYIIPHTKGRGYRDRIIIQCLATCSCVDYPQTAFALIKTAIAYYTDIHTFLVPREDYELMQLINDRYQVRFKASKFKTHHLMTTSEATIN